MIKGIANIPIYLLIPTVIPVPHKKSLIGDSPRDVVIDKVSGSRGNKNRLTITVTIIIIFEDTLI